MSIEQTLLQEIEESKRWLNIENEDTTYKRDLQKRIELINCFLEKMKNPDIFICDTRGNFYLGIRLEVVEQITRQERLRRNSRTWRINPPIDTKNI
jgi:hypothetical protein